MEKYKVEFTDTFGGDANYYWIDKYIVEATSLKQATTKAKKLRYYSPLPAHKTSDYGDMIRIDIMGEPVCAFIEYIEEEI